jgi:PEP-CTERM motif
MQRHRFIPGRVTLGCFIAAMFPLATAVTARAANSPVTFAQFEQSTASSNSNQFAYLDNGPAADAVLTTESAGVNGVSIPVNFTFLTVSGSLPADLRGPLQAHLTLTTNTTAAVQTVNAFGGTLAHQQVFGTSAAPDVLAITLDSPAAEGTGSRTNLLTMSFTGGLLGQLGQATPSLSGNTANGDTVTYSSDFVGFSSSAANDFNVAFTSWVTNLVGGGLSLSATAGDSYFASATAAGAATFDSTIVPSTTSSPVPEPATGGMALIGIGLLTLTARRGRKLRAA